ncbi:hypothetical protein ACFQVC_24025 [Streptomyces monticola]|uniref:Uncharacterized protein n=1 Tax=Streptomyces monticola TaxID=2666263 RepID=A0ABW2JM97_9ACTN
MEIRVRVVGDDASPEALSSLRAWLEDARRWRITPGDDAFELVVELAGGPGGGRELTELGALVDSWRRTRADAVAAALSGPEPDAYGGIAPLDSHSSSEPDDAHATGNTPPGPVIDPGDDWPRE